MTLLSMRPVLHFLAGKKNPPRGRSGGGADGSYRLKASNLHHDLVDGDLFAGDRHAFCARSWTSTPSSAGAAIVTFTARFHGLSLISTTCLNVGISENQASRRSVHIAYIIAFREEEGRR